MNYAAPTNPAVSIYLNGSNVTNQTLTQPVIVGQQVALTSSVTGGLPSSWSWTLSTGNYVGGYSVPGSPGNNGNMGCLVDANAPNPNQCVPPGTPVVTSGPDLTIYFVPPVPAGPVTVTLTVAGSWLGPPQTANVTFNVIAPLNAGVAVTGLQGPTVVPGAQPVLQLGNPPPGISFQGSATPPAGYAGALLYVQLLQLRNAVFVYPNGTSSTCVGSGLDTEFPYRFSNPPVNTQTNDTPSLNLTSAYYTSESVSDAYSMFLMWQPTLANAIPVPLGYVDWAWTGLATFIWNSWVLTNAPEAGFSVTQPTTTYPQWSQVFTTAKGLTCGAPQ